MNNKHFTILEVYANPEVERPLLYEIRSELIYLEKYCKAKGLKFTNIRCFPNYGISSDKRHMSIRKSWSLNRIRIAIDEFVEMV